MRTCEWEYFLKKNFFLVCRNKFFVKFLCNQKDFYYRRYFQVFVIIIGLSKNVLWLVSFSDEIFVLTVSAFISAFSSMSENRLYGNSFSWRQYNLILCILLGNIIFSLLVFVPESIACSLYLRILVLWYPVKIKSEWNLHYFSFDKLYLLKWSNKIKFDKIKLVLI